MQKVSPDLYRKLTPAEYKIEFDRIEREIKNMSDVDFEIIVNTDVPFYCDFLRTYRRPILENFDNYERHTFKEFTTKSISTQKSVYIRYLQNVYMFHWSMFLKN